MVHCWYETSFKPEVVTPPRQSHYRTFQSQCKVVEFRLQTLLILLLKCHFFKKMNESHNGSSGIPHNMLRKAWRHFASRCILLNLKHVIWVIIFLIQHVSHYLWWTHAEVVFSVYVVGYFDVSPARHVRCMTSSDGISMFLVFKKKIKYIRDMTNRGA